MINNVKLQCYDVTNILTIYTFLLIFLTNPYGACDPSSSALIIFFKYIDKNRAIELTFILLFPIIL